MLSNFVYLAIVALIPFPSQVLGQSDEVGAVILYAAVLCAGCCVTAAMWFYARRRDLLDAATLTAWSRTRRCERLFWRWCLPCRFRLHSSSDGTPPSGCGLPRFPPDSCWRAATARSRTSCGEPERTATSRELRAPGISYFGAVTRPALPGVASPTNRMRPSASRTSAPSTAPRSGPASQALAFGS